MIKEIFKNLHLVKNEIMTIPSFFHINKYENQRDLENHKFLKKNGYLPLGKIIKDETIEIINNKITEKINSNKASYLEKQKIWKISFLDDFENHLQEIIDISTIHLISNYFKRNFYLSDVDIRKVLPAKFEDISNMGKSNSDWHKDVRGRQLKIMIYLSNVGQKDSFFSFIPRTHNKRTYDFNKSRFEPNKVNLKNEKKWFDFKGHAMIFDTNITHRLNRQVTSSLRNSLTLYFTPGQSLRKIFSGNYKNLNSGFFKKITEKNSFFEKRV